MARLHRERFLINQADTIKKRKSLQWQIRMKAQCIPMNNASGKHDCARSMGYCVEPRPKDPPKLRIAIVGLGRLGGGILADLCQQDWIGAIHCYSKSYGDDYEELEADLCFAVRRPYFHCSLESALSLGTDLLIISTGPAIRNFRKYRNRQKILSRLYLEGAAKVSPIFRAVAEIKYSGLISILTNPPGAHLSAAFKHFDIDPARLTSFPPDLVRARWLLTRVLKNFCLLKGFALPVTSQPLLARDFTGFLHHRDTNGQNSTVVAGLASQDVDLPVIGEHGSEIPLLGQCRVGGVQLGDIHPIFLSPDFVEEFTRALRAIGHSLMVALEKRGGGYYTAPKAAVKMIKQCALAATGQIESADEYVYTYVQDLDAFLSVPARITGPPLRVCASPEFSLLGLPYRVREELNVQAEAQRQFLLTKESQTVEFLEHERQPVGSR